MNKQKMTKRSDIITLLVRLLQSPQATDMCRLYKIDPVKSVHLERKLKQNGSRYWDMEINLENDSFKLTIEDNNEEEE